MRHDLPAWPAGSAPAGRRQPSKQLTLAVMAATGLMLILDLTITNVALPTVQQALAMTPQALQWVVNAYALVYGGFLLLGGRLADRLGRRRVFLAGVAVFTVASLLGGLAVTGGVLVAARGLQGLGAALAGPAALSGCWPAGCSPSTPAGAGSCSSTSRSGRSCSWPRRGWSPPSPASGASASTPPARSA